jgi:hypothetical protein
MINKTLANDEFSAIDGKCGGCFKGKMTGGQ